MPRSPVPWNWKGEDITVPVTDHETPPAALALIRSAEAYTVNAAITPYCGCARSFDGVGFNLGGGFSGPGERYIGQMVAPGAYRARAFISRAAENVDNQTPNYVAGEWYPNRSWTTYGGTTGVYIVKTNADSDFANAEYSVSWDRYYGFSPTTQGWVMTSDTDEPTPAASMDRMYVLESLKHPKVEPMFVTCATGFSFVVAQRVGDLETL